MRCLERVGQGRAGQCWSRGKSATSGRSRRAQVAGLGQQPGGQGVRPVRNRDFLDARLQVRGVPCGSLAPLHSPPAVEGSARQRYPLTPVLDYRRTKERLLLKRGRYWVDEKEIWHQIILDSIQLLG